jgi:nucleoside-diphosphate-sugar epimerase
VPPDIRKNNIAMKVIVFGATGAIGAGLIDIILQNRPTWHITAVTRDAGKAKLIVNDAPNVCVIEGDPNNKEDVMRLTADKDIIYSCVGFTKYEAKYWGLHWPIVVDNLLEGSSQRTGQKLIFCDNLYAYGPGKEISPSSPTVPPSMTSKPGVRAMIRPMLKARMDRDPSSISVVGAADFFGPGITKQSFLGDTFTKGIVDGKSRPLIFGSSSKIHDFCYAKDLSNA